MFLSEVLEKVVDVDEQGRTGQGDALSPGLSHEWEKSDGVIPLSRKRARGVRARCHWPVVSGILCEVARVFSREMSEVLE
jgi:hypothetical protein